MLADATPLEQEILGAFEFQSNEAVLHTDTSLMPRKKRTWASWNYHISKPESGPELPAVTYWMNKLQDLPGETPYLLTLNRNEATDPDKVLRRFQYDHPIFSTKTVQSQRRHAEIDGVEGVHFCGAYWRYGFHEDGVQSAMAVLRNLNEKAVAR